MRIAIAGSPRAGKTTLARKLGVELDVKPFSTDDVIHLGWSEASADVATRLLGPGPYVIEGVAVMRALRKALDRHPTRKPCDRLLWLERPHQALNAGQQRMFAADEARLREIEPELLRRGVEIVRERSAVAAPVSTHKQATEDNTVAPDDRVLDMLATDSRWGSYGGRGFG